MREVLIPNEYDRYSTSCFTTLSLALKLRALLNLIFLSRFVFCIGLFVEKRRYRDFKIAS